MSNTYRSVDDLKRLLENFCAYRERSYKEIDKKMDSLNIVGQVKDVILTELIQNNFLNEERYAKAFVRGKFNQNKWGKQKIKLHLKQNDISKVNIDLALAQIDSDIYLQTINQLLTSKYSTIKSEPNIYKSKQKIQQFLYNKGYESELIYRAIDDFFSDL